MDRISDSDSEDVGSIPTGTTNHNLGKSKYTSGHRPWKLIYTEAAGSSVGARKREKYFKSAAGKNHLHKISDA